MALGHLPHPTTKLLLVMLISDKDLKRPKDQQVASACSSFSTVPSTAAGVTASSFTGQESTAPPALHDLPKNTAADLFKGSQLACLTLRFFQIANLLFLTATEVCWYALEAIYQVSSRQVPSIKGNFQKMSHTQPWFTIRCKYQALQSDDKNTHSRNQAESVLFSSHSVSSTGNSGMLQPTGALFLSRSLQRAAPPNWPLLLCI